jgi:hypothetical protein
MSNTDIDTLTVQLRRVLQQTGVGEEGGFDTDEEKYITASDESVGGRSESENPQDTENLKEQADLSPENSCAYLNSGPGVRSNDDFRRVFKSIRFVPQESKTTYGPRITLRAKKTVSGNSPIHNHENEDLPSPNNLRRTRRLFQAESSKAHTAN